MELAGIHHLTAITADAPGALAFYTGPLGLRLVKKTVNQDDVSAYHLFFADGEGTPGSDITFFDWAAPREQRGTRSIVRTGFRVGNAESLQYWLRRFEELIITHGEIEDRDGRLTLDFEDPEGQRLCLVVDGDALPHPWEKSPVPAEHQLRGLGPITISVPELTPTSEVLTDVMGMRLAREYEAGSSDGRGSVITTVFAMGNGGPGAELHVAVEPRLNPARQGAGGAHHVAFRVPDEEEQLEWSKRLDQHSIASSGQIDRFWFKSVYFREPAGILFELATDGPGFAADEPVENLGQKLSLPPFLEGRRQQIEAALRPL